VSSRKPESIRVYLDSSDISYLADADKLAANPALRQVRQELVELCEQGAAEFRFSFFHILELAHLDPAHKPHAQARAEFVEALCGRRAFLHPDKLRRLEALSLVRKGGKKSNGAAAQVYVTDASWLPQSIVAVVDRFTDALIRGLHNRIAEQTTQVVEESAPNRATRRAMKREFVDRRGATKKAVKIATRTPDYFFGNWQQVYPLTERFWRDKLLFDYLDNKLSKEELHRECLNGFADLNNFVGWCIDQIPSIRAMPQAIRGTESAGLFDDLRSDAGQRLDVAKDILGELDLEPATREHVLQSLEAELQAATSPDLRKARRDELVDLYRSDCKWFAAHGVTRNDFDDSVIGSPLNSLPSLDTLVRVVGAHFKKLAKLGVNYPKLKRSDLSDLLHCTYLPYVDVFSADRRTGELIADVANAYGTLLVHDTASLPAAIRQKLTTCS
jgi:hypothetical protein